MARAGSARRTALLVAGLLHVSPLVAQAPGEAGPQIFTPDYFDQFNPVDAYDMVRRLPGFKLVEIDEDVRGFTGSRGNVLVDGRTPPGKGQTLEQLLRRLPASSVLRIELIRGGSHGGATGSFDLVANIVRRSRAATSGSVLAGASAAREIGLKPDARLEYSRESGPRRLQATVGLSTEIDEDSGTGDIIEVEAGEPRGSIIARDEREYKRKLVTGLEYDLPVAGGILSANFNGARETKREEIRSKAEGFERASTERERTWSAETAAQFKVPAGAGELETLVSHRTEWLNAVAREEQERFSENVRTSETLARAEFRREGKGLQLVGSLEAALNRLRGKAELSEGDVVQPIIGSDVAVSERRAEASIGATWQPARQLTLETTLRGEYSAIHSTGDASQQDNFLFLKPRMRISWDNGLTRVQLSLQREAAQLDFEDFLASADLDRDDVLAGAPSLKPPTTWTFSALAEQRFWKGGSLILTFRRERIDDVIDRVLVADNGELFDAVGNIGRARRTIIEAELTTPLDQLGLGGMELRVDLIYVKSRVTDPITGAGRPISEDKPFEGEIRVTHDIPGGRWSWGAEAIFGSHEREYRFDEFRREQSGLSTGAHVEFRPARNWRIRAEVENISWKGLRDERHRFDGPRSTGVLESVTTRRIDVDPIFTFSVRRSLGAAKD